MSRRVVVPRRISQAIRELGLDRQVAFNHIHADIAKDYPKFRAFRSSDERLCLYRIAIGAADVTHLFVFGVDDTTAAEYLILESVWHGEREAQ